MKLTEDVFELLNEVIEKRCPEFKGLFKKHETIELNEDQVNRICLCLSDELCESGLKEDSEPNKRGLMLDDLIGYINQLRFKK